jgi:hypothetical protein
VAAAKEANSLKLNADFIFMARSGRLSGLDHPLSGDVSCALSTVLGSTESISLAVLFLKALPIAELVLPLDDELGH